MSQVHVGTGYRVQKVLQKAARGERLRVGVLGGSGTTSLSISATMRPLAHVSRRAVSLGHGTDPVTMHRNKYGAVPLEAQYHQRIVKYLEAAYPQAQIDFVLGAKAATDSSFFEWCWPSLMFVAFLSTATWRLKA